MDASDIIRKLQAKTIFAYTKTVQQTIQPACQISSCCGTPGCTFNFPDYAYRYNFYEGQKACSTCTFVFAPSSIVNTVCGCSNN